MSDVKIVGHWYTPRPVGFWVLYPGGPMTTHFAMYTKPTDEQIENTKKLLGWGWQDNVSSFTESSQTPLDVEGESNGFI